MTMASIYQGYGYKVKWTRITDMAAKGKPGNAGKTEPINPIRINRIPKMINTLTPKISNTASIDQNYRKLKECFADISKQKRSLTNLSMTLLFNQ